MNSSVLQEQFLSTVSDRCVASRGYDRTPRIFFFSPTSDPFKGLSFRLTFRAIRLQSLFSRLTFRPIRLTFQAIRLFFSQPFNVSTYPFNVSSHPFIFFLSRLTVYGNRFWTLLYRLTFWTNRLNALKTRLLSVYKPFIFSRLTEKR